MLRPRTLTPALRVRAPGTHLPLVRGVTTSNGEELFDKILVANRGEIACRVIRTAKRLGIKTVAVFSEPDRYGMHVQEADEAILVGPAAAADSYLRQDRILEAVRSTGAQAVHPGYGFLSENAEFSGMLADEGVAFIGPGARAITAMGDKIESKIIAKEAGVNTIPGHVGVVETNEEVVKIAREIGYPVMIKASAGGGGKGMRIAWDDEGAVEGFHLSKEEAAASFGDDRIFIEKFIEEPRHIEIQLIADKHGNYVALNERECSIQRRNQKVLEEAPSVLLDPDTRAAMAEQACMLARAVDYHSAGTVEMLVDKHMGFYFLEMNTRLQVEHPVSEMITGVDLVEQMIRVAAGHRLPADLIENPMPINGWALEARVYAEDPFRGFLPATGRLPTYKPPSASKTGPTALWELQEAGGMLSEPLIRLDSGIQQGSEISMFYDPMISKLVTWAPDREGALAAMRVALDEYVIKGVAHNTPFLRALVDHPRFIDGSITTGFIEEEYPDGFKGVELSEDAFKQVAGLAGVMNRVKRNTAESISGRASHASYTEDGDISIVTMGEKKFQVAIVDSDGVETFQVAVVDLEDGSKADLSFGDFDWAVEEPLLKARLYEDKEASDLRLQHLSSTDEGMYVYYQGALLDVIVRTEREEELAGHMLPIPEVDYSKILVSPMPGMLKHIMVKEGDVVQEGQPLVVVEAMKMQNVLRAPKKTTIGKIHFDEDATLAVDEVILDFVTDVSDE